MNNNLINSNMKEQCVLCKKELEVLTTTPIQEREFYVTGVGQLCTECYHDIYREGE